MFVTRPKIGSLLDMDGTLTAQSPSGAHRDPLRRVRSRGASSYWDISVYTGLRGCTCTGKTFNDNKRICSCISR